MSSKKAKGEGNLRKNTRTVNYVDASGEEVEYTYSTWEARYMVEENGVKERKSVYGKSQEDVRIKLQTALNAINNNTYFEPSKMTYGEWLDEWLDSFCVDVKPLTIKKYRTDVRIHIKPALGDIKLRDLKSIHIQNFYNRLKDEGKAPKSIRCIHGAVSKSLNVAMRQELIIKNPASLVTLPRMTQKKIVPLTDDQIRDFLDIVDEDECARELKLILFTGLREGECLGLTWDCVSFGTDEITIDKQLVRNNAKGTGCSLQPTKNDKERILTVPEFVMDILHEQYKQQGLDRLAAGEYWEGWQTQRERRKALVFTNPRGKCLTHAYIYSHYKKLAAKIDAPYSTVHDLRHTYAVLSLQNGDDVKTLQSNLGHATAAFTLDRYGHVSDKMKKASADRMQKYINRIS